VLAVTPGATTAVVVRNTIERGARAGVAAALGASAGNTIQAAVAAVGLAVVLVRWPMAAFVIRAAGAAFLMWLGLRSLWRASAYPAVARPRKPRLPGGTVGTGFRQGLMVNLLNPAITSFYVAVVPSFVPPGAPWWYYSALASAHIGIAFACHACWTLAFDRLRSRMERPWFARGMEAVTGLILVALAINVMASAS
jgi:threonine/homoserine/homoserine lactone efflux protein